MRNVKQNTNDKIGLSKTIFFQIKFDNVSITGTHRDYFAWQIWKIDKNPSCSSSYFGETCRHFKTRTDKPVKKDNKSHIFKHLQSTTTCFDSLFFCVCFSFIQFMYMTWLKKRICSFIFSLAFNVSSYKIFDNMDKFLLFFSPIFSFFF